MTKDGKKVVDTFIFYNELDLLDVRLHEHDRFVDYFVLAENPIAFNVQSKNEFYKENMDRFSEFKDNILVTGNDRDFGGDSWNREWSLRNSVRKGVEYLLNETGEIKEDDWVILSDLDEIIRSSCFKEQDFANDKRYKFDLSFRYYKFNCREVNDGWAGPIMVPVGVFLKHNPQDIRHHSNNPDITESNTIYVPKAGWHFSYMGGVDKVISKINTGGHQELNNDTYKDVTRIATKLKYGEDLFDREGHYWEFINDDDYPKYVLDNPEMFKPYFQEMKRYNFQLVIPFTGEYNLLKWAIESSIGHVEMFIDKDKRTTPLILVVNNSGVKFDWDKLDIGMNAAFVSVEDLIEPMLISQTLNWAIKRAKLYKQDFMIWMHDDAALKTNALKIMFDKYEEIKGTKWGSLFLAKDGDVCSIYNIDFNYTENVWYEPMMFPVYFMDCHYFKIQRLRGWSMEYANWDHPVDLVIHGGSHTLKHDPIFRRKNDLMQESLHLLFKAIWGGPPGEETLLDPHANGTC